MKSRVPVTNRGLQPILVEIEPEGETVELESGETCDIQLDRELGEVCLELAVTKDLLLVYAMCGKRVQIRR